MVPRDWVDLSVFVDAKYDISEEIELSFIVAEYYAQIGLQNPNALPNDALKELAARRTLMMAMPKILTATTLLAKCPSESNMILNEICQAYPGM